jgi:phosphoenolpyruvate-protein phosphotransferase (PTS system enzyme I)
MAGEPIYALVLLGLGLDELSMNGPSIPLVKRVLRAASAADGRRLVERILELTAADEIEREVRKEMVSRFGALLDSDASVGPAAG